MESFLCTGITLAAFSVEGKTPEAKKILNISDSWMKILFVINFNLLPGIMLGPTDILESNEDMVFSISAFSVGLTKNEMLGLFLWKSEKCLWENEILSFVLLSIEK